MYSSQTLGVSRDAVNGEVRLRSAEIARVVTAASATATGDDLAITATSTADIHYVGRNGNNPQQAHFVRTATYTSSDSAGRWLINGWKGTVDPGTASPEPSASPPR